MKICKHCGKKEQLDLVLMRRLCCLSDETETEEHHGKEEAGQKEAQEKELLS